MARYESIVYAISRMVNIQVIQNPGITTACTDGKVVQIGVFPTPEEIAKKFNLLIHEATEILDDLIAMLAFHEPLHLLHSEFSGVNVDSVTNKAQWLMQLLNVLEDRRIEIRGSQDFNGGAMILRKGNDALFRLMPPEKPQSGESQLSILLSWLNMKLIYENFRSPLIKDAIDLIEPSLELKNKDQLFLIAENYSTSDRTFAEVCEGVLEIFKLIKDEAKKDQQGQSQQGQGQQGQGQQGQSQQGQAQQGQSQQGQGQQGQGQQGQSQQGQSQQGQSQQGQSQQGQGQQGQSQQGQAQQGQSQQGQSQQGQGQQGQGQQGQGSGSGVGSGVGNQTPTAAQQILDSDGNGIQNMDIADRIARLICKPKDQVTSQDRINAEAFNFLATESGPSSSVDMSSIRGSFSPDYETQRVIDETAGRLDLELQAFTETSTMDSDEGEVNLESFHEVMFGNLESLFYEESEERSLDSTCVCLKLDISGSMGDARNGRLAIDVAKSGIGALAVALQRLDIPFTIDAFESKTWKVKQFHESWSEVGRRLSNLSHQGGTDLVETYSESVKALAERSEKRKILLTITDGSPSRSEMFPLIQRFAKDVGVETKWVLIIPPSSAQAFANNLGIAEGDYVASDGPGLSEAIVDSVKEVLFDPVYF